MVRLVVPLCTLAYFALLAPLPPAALAKKPRLPFNLLRTKLVSKVSGLEHCTDKEHFFRITNVSVSMDRLGGDVFDIYFELLSPAKRISSVTYHQTEMESTKCFIFTQIKLIMVRCTAGSATACEIYDTWSWSSGLCDLLLMNHMTWSNAIAKIQPPLKCPLEAGSHTMQNVSMDLDALSQAIPGFNLDKYTWKSECQTQDEAMKLYTCFRWVTDVRRVRVKDENILLG